MMRKPMLRILAVVFFVCFAGCRTTTPVKPETDIKTAETAAVDAARAWLSIVDSQKYSESWEEASQFFKANVTKQQWVQSIQSVRRPLNKNISRELRSKKYSANLPGAPKGEYVIIEFGSSFENRKSAIETVTVMLDKDGKWRASGYFMR
jgi:hypothetical protein